MTDRTEQKTITEAEILAAFDAAGHDCIDISDLTKTAETLADFRAAAKGWNECRRISDDSYAGHAALEFDGVQVRKGDRRTAVTVIDFGDVRYAHKI